MARARKVAVHSGFETPDFSLIKRESRNFKKYFDEAMYFAHYELTEKKLKTNVMAYIKSLKLDAKAAESAPQGLFSVVGKVAFIVNNGGQLPEDWDNYLKSQTKKIIEAGTAVNKAKSESSEDEDDKPKKKVVGIQDRMRDQANEVAGEFEGWVDEFMDSPSKFKPESYDPFAVMMKASMKAGHARYIIKFYQPEIDNLTALIDKTDDELAEGYSYGLAQLKRLRKLYESITAAATMIIEASKVTRKPRAKKAVSADKQVARLKYLKSDTSLGIMSVSPRDIIGSQEVWVYNTKTRKIGKYAALDAIGLGVKGTTITNFAEKSVEKTLRKPPEQLKKFKAAGKVALRKYLDEIKAVDIKLRGRLSDHHVILKVVR